MKEKAEERLKFEMEMKKIARDKKGAAQRERKKSFFKTLRQR